MASSGVFCCHRAHLSPSETKRGVCGHDRGADCRTPAADAGGWNQYQRRAGEWDPCITPPPGESRPAGQSVDCTRVASIFCCMAASVLVKGMFRFCVLVKKVCLHRWKLFRGSTSSACLMSSLCSTVCTVSVLARCSRLVFNRPVLAGGLSEEGSRLTLTCLRVR